MSQWAGGVLTAAGRVLQAKVESGTTLTLTKIKLGDGTETMSAVDNLTDLVSPKAVLGISSATSDGDVATITGVMSASLLQAGFYCREWGLFAQDPDTGEILYMITIDSQPEWLPASTQAAQVSATYAMNIAVANATNIEVNIDPAGLVDVEMLNSILGVADRSTAYNVGDMASMPGLPAEHYLYCVTAGTTGATTPVIGTVTDGDLIADGTVVWRVTRAMSAAELGYRQPSTAYTAGKIAYHASLPTGWYLESTTGGTTDAGALVITSPSVGGTVTDGTVVWTVNRSISAVGTNVVTNGNVDRYLLRMANSNSTLQLAGGSAYNTGAQLVLYGGGSTGLGRFMLSSGKTTSDPVKYLTGENDGTLTWNSADLAGSAIVAKSIAANGYIKYASGLIQQWGTIAVTAANTNTVITFPISFTTTHALMLLPYTSGTNNVNPIMTRVLGTPSKDTIQASAVPTNQVMWYAIGY